MTDDWQGLVFDNGSGMCKCGFSGDDAPRAVFPTVVGRPKYPGIMIGMQTKDCYVGDEAQAKRGILRLRYPIDNGIMNNWMDMEKIWHHSFYNELCVTPEEHPVLLTECPLNPKNSREKMTSVMFEKFDVPALYIVPQSVLALIHSGKETGISLDCGDGVNLAVPVVGGHALRHAIWKTTISGRDVTEHFFRNMKGYEITSCAEREIVRDMKEKLAYIALDYEKELKKAEKLECVGEYKLPGGSTMKIGPERFQAPEILFNPSMIKSEEPGIQELIFNSIQRCDFDLRKTLYSNIVLSGGSTLFEGIVDRLKKELKEYCPKTSQLRIFAPKDRKFSVWIGGSILSSLDSFTKMWMIKEEYDEIGSTIVHRKCF